MTSSSLLQSFIEVSPDSHFPIQNLPYGVFNYDIESAVSSQPRIGVAIGEYVLDLFEVASAGLFDGPLLKSSDCFYQVVAGGGGLYYFVLVYIDVLYCTCLMFDV